MSRQLQTIERTINQLANRHRWTLSREDGSSVSCKLLFFFFLWICLFSFTVAGFYAGARLRTIAEKLLNDQKKKKIKKCLCVCVCVCVLN